MEYTKYIPTDWIAHLVANENTFILESVDPSLNGVVVKLDPQFGVIIQQGTPVTKEALNKIEAGIEYLSSQLDPNTNPAKVPYQGHIGSFNTSKDGVPVAIFGDNVVTPSSIKGLSLNQEVLNGDLASGVSPFSTNLVTLSNVSNVLNMTITTPSISTGVYTSPSLISPAVISHKYFITIDIFPLYANSLAVSRGGGRFVFNDLIANQWNTRSVIVTATSTAEYDFYHDTSINYIAGDIFKYDNIMSIDITNTPLANLTAVQIALIVPTYFEGELDYIPNLTTIGEDTNIEATISWAVNGVPIPLRSVGTVRDILRIEQDNYVKDEYVGKDTTVVKSATYTSNAPLTNTIRYFSKLTTLLDYKVASSLDTITNIKVVTGNITYTVTSYNYSTSNDIENLISVDTNGNLIFRVNKTTYPTIASFEAYLQANDVTLYYELATPTTEIVEVTGSMIVVPEGMYIQNSVICGEFDVLVPLDTGDQIKAIITYQLQLQKSISDKLDAREAIITEDGSSTRINFGGVTKLAMNATVLQSSVNLDMQNKQIKTVADPTLAQDVATKAYVDATKVKTNLITVTQAVDLDAIETKTDLITVTQPVDLDAVELDLGKAPKYTLIMSTVVNVSGSISSSTVNITLSESMDNFDYLKIMCGVSVTSISSMNISEFNILEDGYSHRVDFVGGNYPQMLIFTLKRLSSTTMVAYQAVSIVTTYGTPASIASDPSTVCQIYKIYGVKL